ncbi:MAG: cell wall hydrolase [Clostridia bacterium]|nr:cell wall hydrolase [Clostridia bacterium]
MEHNKYGIGNVFSIGTQNKMNKNDEENEIENNVNKRKNKKQVEKNVAIAKNEKFKFRMVVAVVLVFVVSVFAVGSILIAGSFNNSTQIVANETNTRIVQAKLASLGYYNEAIDGVFDDSTIQAIKDYQSDKNLAVTGNLDFATTTALGVTDNAQANTDLYLLAKLIYSEARGESYEGQVAVGAVVLNRVDDAGFPNTLQGVIYQPWAFTALHDGQFQLEPNSTAYQAAQDAMNGWDPTYGCLYYYNPRTATSSWIFSRTVVVTIGNHVFCY